MQAIASQKLNNFDVMSQQYGSFHEENEIISEGQQ